MLNGRKSMIAYAPNADVLLVTARIQGPDQPGAMAVFAVPHNAPGMRIVRTPMVDGAIAGEIVLEDVTLPAQALLGESTEDAESRIADVLDAGIAAVCAEAVGALDKLLAATVEYARTRKQFGVPIGKFQALQHRMADMVLHIEQARSMSYLAAVRCTDPDLKQRRHDLSAAKVHRWPGLPLRRPAGGAAAWRDGSHGRARCQPLLQAADGHRNGIRQH